MLKIVSWNCRDLGGLRKVEAITEIINSERPDRLLLQATKIPDVEAMALSCCFWKNNKGKSISSKGASRGIATIISGKFLVKSIRESHHWLLTKIQEKEDLIHLYICNVYGATHYRDKTTIWEDLNKLNEELRGKDIIIVRDFNTIKSEFEKQ